MPTKVDPQLHILRSVSNAVINPTQRHEAQSARFKLFSALEAQNYGEAIEWLEALEVSLNSVDTPLEAKAMDSANRAIAAIRKQLYEQTSATT